MAGAKFRVLAVADGMIPSVELVLERPLSYLANEGEIEFSLHTIEDADGIGRELDRCDLLVLMRACQANALALVKAARARSLPVVYAIDDDFESLDPATPWGATTATQGRGRDYSTFVVFAIRYGRSRMF